MLAFPHLLAFCIYVDIVLAIHAEDHLSGTVTVHPRRYVRSHRHVSMRLQNPQHERKIAFASISRAIARARYEICSRNCNASDCHLLLSPLACFIQNERYDTLQQQETLYFEYTSLGSNNFPELLTIDDC